MKYIVAYSSCVGRKLVNQDAMLIKTACIEGINLGLFVVCDGLGGLNHGEVASSNIVKDLNAWFENEKHQLKEQNNDQIESNLKNEINKINKKIIGYSKKIGAKVGSTLTMILNVGEKNFCCHVGDCRIYEIGDEIFKLTKDHTLVQREIDEGKLNVEAARIDRRKNILLQCIGVKEKIEIDFLKWNVPSDKVYLLCSDGLYKSIEEDNLREEFRSGNNFKEWELQNKIEDLTNLALANGERDNISAIAFSLV